MKCPKCGFNSFEFLDSCKKCGNALTPFKNNHGIRAVILPSRQTAAPPAEPSAAPVSENTLPQSDADQFSWEPPPAAEPAGPAGDNFAGLGTDMGTAGDRGAFDFTDSATGEGGGGNLAAFSFDEPVEPEEPAGPGYGDALGGEELADLLESSGTAGNWGGDAGPATSGGFTNREFEGFAEAFALDESGGGAATGPSAPPGELEPGDFPFETESAPKKGTPPGGGTGGPDSR